METAKILQADYLDLVFDNRNKSYGGYELRKHYQRRAFKALSITLSVIVLGIGAPFVIGKLHAKNVTGNTKNKNMDIAMTDLVLPPPPPAPPIPPPPPEAPDAPPATAETIKNFPPEIVKDNIVPPNLKPPSIEELKNAESGPVSSPGQGGSEVATSKDPYNGPFGKGEKPVINKNGGGSEVSNEAVRSADIIPEFPGGIAALMAYLKKNLRYPEEAKSDGIEGKVVVTFVVNAQGGIERAKVERAIGGGCDQEALRVVNAMPKWKPGQQGGHNVKVYYTLPISFRLDR